MKTQKNNAGHSRQPRTRKSPLRERVVAYANTRDTLTRAELIEHFGLKSKKHLSEVLQAVKDHNQNDFYAIMQKLK